MTETKTTLEVEDTKKAFWQSGWFNTLGRFIALVIVFSFFAILVEGGKFYTPRNLENILRQSAVYATAGLGMTMVIITRLRRRCTLSPRKYHTLI